MLVHGGGAKDPAPCSNPSETHIMATSRHPKLKLQTYVNPKLKLQTLYKL